MFLTLVKVGRHYHHCHLPHPAKIQKRYAIMAQIHRSSMHIKNPGVPRLSRA